jgi:hypothetical protein
MAKREREHAEPQAEAPTTVASTHPAVCTVFSSRDILWDTISQYDTLALTDLWSLYVCCSGTFHALQDHPDICLFREARIHHHGRLYVPLKKALKRGDVRIARSLAAYLKRALDPGWSKIAFLACGISLFYVQSVYRVEAVIDPENAVTSCLAHSLSSKNDAHFRRVEAWAVDLVNGLPSSRDSFSYGPALGQAVANGCVDVAVDLTSDEGFDNEYADEWLTHPYEWRSTNALDFLALRCPGAVEDFIQRLTETDAFPNLLLIKWLACFANRMRIDANYERWHVWCMSVMLVSRKRAEVLRWLAPLALKQFNGRRHRDETAQPLFPSGQARHRGEPQKKYAYHMFPGLHDPEHYADRHVDNWHVVKGHAQ